MHLAAQRVDARHHVLDDAVLAGCIHGLEHDEHRPAVLGIEPLLQVGESPHAVGEDRLGIFLVERKAEVFGGMVISNPKPLGVWTRQCLRIFESFISASHA